MLKPGPEDRAQPTSGASAGASSGYQWYNRGGVFAAACLIYAFLNMATFNSLGVVLFRMLKELHWSMTEAGFNFSLLGIACGLTSPPAAWFMRKIGSRLTIGLGAALLVAGFVLASTATSLIPFYVAMVLLGIGYAFAGVVPAVNLITGWFGPLSARFIGFYYMLGALGAAIGPPLALFTIGVGGGWRGHWQIMAISALAIGAICLALIRDAAPSSAAASAKAVAQPGLAPVVAVPVQPEWTTRRAMFTGQFLLITLSQTLTMASVTTNSSVVVVHLAQHGVTATAAALVLSVIALSATLIKGVAGRICESVQPSHVLTVGLVLQGLGNLLLLAASGPVMPYLAGAVLGVGWGFAYVAGTVVLLRYFGDHTGTQLLAFSTFLVTAAATGPLLAGVLGDHYHSVAAIFYAYAAIFLAVSVPTFLMRAPAPPGKAPSAA